MNKIRKRVFSIMMVIVTLITTGFTSSTSAFASKLVLNEKTGYSYNDVSPYLGYSIVHDNVFITKQVESDGTVDAVMTEEINSFLETIL